MAIDTRDKRQNICNIVTRGGIGLNPDSSGIDSQERKNTSFIYGFITYTANVVPTNIAEVLYPIQPMANSNVVALQADDKEWDSLQKSETAWRHEIVKLRFRIRDIDIETFYEFHVNNKGNIVTLGIEGVQPFIRADESNQVYVVSFTAPVLVWAKHYEMSVTYLNVQRTAT